MYRDAEQPSGLNTPEAWSQRAQEEDPLRAVMWSPQGQAERFTSVLSALDPNPRDTFLDFGCGTGALSPFLWPDTYLGYDWAYPMVRRARTEHPGYEFAATLSFRRFDLVACIGTFNLHGSHSDTWATIKSLWDRTNKALAACLYSGADDNCLQYDAYDLFDFASKTLGVRRWRVDQHRHNDLLLVMWR